MSPFVVVKNRRIAVIQSDKVLPYVGKNRELRTFFNIDGSGMFIIHNFQKSRLVFFWRNPYSTVLLIYNEHQHIFIRSSCE
jgi:hypothetical protein